MSILTIFITADDFKNMQTYNKTMNIKSTRRKNLKISVAYTNSFENVHKYYCWCTVKEIKHETCPPADSRHVLYVFSVPTCTLSKCALGIWNPRLKLKLKPLLRSKEEAILTSQICFVPFDHPCGSTYSSILLQTLVVFFCVIVNIIFVIW